ncbi:hypothetical protein M758_5G125700 [Ceratodon purpureus]|nr:hypothetical protein M758_5G125700 [Ceratodon purpureus]
MAPLFHSAVLVVLAVLVTICSLHIDHVLAACPAGMKNCGKDTLCRTNTRSDPNNCGNCNRSCPRTANTIRTCENSRCKNRCKTNFADCDKAAANGCEAYTPSNLNHCGRCGNKCPTYLNAVSACTNGRCTVKCKPGYADCNRNMAKDGCETFVLGTDPGNCGRCGATCKEDQYPFSVSQCKGGKCGIILCYRGMEDCNGDIKDGCERDTFTNPNACGSCGNVCPTYPNAVPICANSWCRSVCKDGFDYCYGPEIDQRGCSQIFFDKDPKNCGGCNNVCAVGQSCQQGVCTNTPA